MAAVGTLPKISIGLLYPPPLSNLNASFIQNLKKWPTRPVQSYNRTRQAIFPDNFINLVIELSHQVARHYNIVTRHLLCIIGGPTAINYQFIIKYIIEDFVSLIFLGIATLRIGVRIPVQKQLIIFNPDVPYVLWEVHRY